MRSDKLGGASLGLFFAAFFFVGCASLWAALVNLTIPDWRANHDFIETTCRLLEKKLVDTTGEQGTAYRPEFRIAYTANGRAYEAWTYDITRVSDADKSASQAVLDRFTLEKEYPCWYDPVHPNQAVLERGHSVFAWLILVLPVSFIAIGGGGLTYTWLNWGKSTERRAAIARRAAQFDPFDEAGDSANRYPYVPGHGNLTNSPGTKLAYRLPTDSSNWALIGLVLITLFWNGVAAIFAALAIEEHLIGRPDWMLTFSLVPLLAVGIGLVVITVRKFLATSGIGPTIVEIDRHPLEPGGKYQLFIAQSGRLSFRSLCVSLVCEEEARYHQGTNLRTATHRVLETEIFRREKFEVEQGSPFETTCQFEIPAGAMHSFRSDHNKIQWKLYVKGDVARWPDFDRSYALSVHPAGGETSAA